MTKNSMNYSAIILSTFFLLSFVSCAPQEKFPRYAEKFQSASKDPRDPINVYNAALMENRPILLIFNVKGAT